MPKQQYVVTPLPLGVSENDKKLFISKSEYKVTLSSVSCKKNIFISHEGLALKNGQLLSSAHFNLKGNQDVTFYFPFWKLAMEQYLVSTYGKSLKKRRLNTGTYLLAHTKWFGYFFWLTSTLPRLIKTTARHNDLKLIYPEGWKNIKYVNESLNMFPDLKWEVVPNGVHLQVKNLRLPATRQWSNAFHPDEVAMTRKFLFGYLDKKGINLNLGEKIYISRKKAARRKPINESELEKLLIGNGYKTVCMEDYDFFEQISIMRNARVVVGLHGAGLANIQFMPKDSTVIELSPKPVKRKDLRIPFWRLAGICRLKYAIQFCDVAKIPASRDIYEANIMVDLERLAKNLEN